MNPLFLLGAAAIAAVVLMKGKSQGPGVAPPGQRAVGGDQPAASARNPTTTALLPVVTDNRQVAPPADSFSTNAQAYMNLGDSVLSLWNNVRAQGSPASEPAEYGTGSPYTDIVRDFPGATGRLGLAETDMED